MIAVTIYKRNSLCKDAYLLTAFLILPVREEMSLINSADYLNKPGEMQYKDEQHYSTEELLN